MWNNIYIYIVIMERKQPKPLQKNCSHLLVKSCKLDWLARIGWLGLVGNQTVLDDDEPECHHRSSRLCCPLFSTKELKKRKLFNTLMESEEASKIGKIPNVLY